MNHRIAVRAWNVDWIACSSGTAAGIHRANEEKNRVEVRGLRNVTAPEMKILPVYRAV